MASCTESMSIYQGAMLNFASLHKYSKYNICLTPNYPAIPAHMVLITHCCRVSSGSGLFYQNLSMELMESSFYAIISFESTQNFTIGVRSLKQFGVLIIVNFRLIGNSPRHKKTPSYAHIYIKARQIPMKPSKNE